MELQLKAAFVWLLLLIFVINLTFGERTRERIYTSISGASCFRRLNGTHQTGCSSAQSGSVGVLHLIEKQDDFNFLLNNPPSPPYAPLIPPDLFTRQNILRLKNEAGKNISVILLINRPEKMTQFSHELNCPNQYSGILMPNSTQTATCDASQQSKTWNPWGTGLLHEDFSFPIYYIADEEEIDKLVNCFAKFNNFSYETHSQRSLCAVEVNTFMSAAVNTEVCMRRTNYINNLSRTKYCDPLEGRNIFSTLFPRNSTENIGPNDERKVNTNEKFILITSRLDTTSMFDGVGLGAVDSLLGYAVLINIAHMLALILPKKDNLVDSKKNILFVVFNGESYDYIGSQRFVYDLENLTFPTRSTQTTPIALANIELMIDIGTMDNISPINMHTINAFVESKNILQKLQKYDTQYKFGINFKSATGIEMPPTSAQSFLRKNLTFPALVLNSSPSNRYYHSIYDDTENVNFTYANTSLDYTALLENVEAFRYFPPEVVQMKIRNISTVVALSLYETLTGKAYNDTEIINPLLIDEFLYCFLQSADCPLFKAASHPKSAPGLPMPPLRYISVSGGSQESSGWTYRLMGYLLSSRVENRTKENCTQLPLYWFAGFNGIGECRLTTQNFSHALSPAFLVEDYDWKSGQYSTWTESTWSQFSARIFLRPSRTHEILTLSIGFTILIISFVVVYFINNRSDILFEDAASSTDALTSPTAL